MGLQDSSIDAEEIPDSGQDTCEYVLEPPRNDSEDEGLIVLCFDISGSMCVTSTLPELQAEWLLAKRKVEVPRQQHRLFSHSSKKRRDQLLPGESSTTVYLSRIECLKEAIKTHLSRISVEYPKKRGLLITFSSDVVVVGAGEGIRRSPSRCLQLL